MSDVFGIGGVAQGIGSVASASIQASAASHAAGLQAQATQNALRQQADQYALTRNDLSPFVRVGYGAAGALENNIAGYSIPDTGGDLNQARQYQGTQSDYANAAQRQFDAASRIGQGPGGQAALEATPGYQFELAQGLQATQNSAAARGLGVSGAAMKGAADYATGLASKNYQQQFSDAMAGGQATQSTANQFGNLSTAALNTNAGYQGNLTNSYNKLLGITGMGESAATKTGDIGANSANAASSLSSSLGNAQGAAALGVGNALSSGINGATNAYAQGQLLNRLYGQNNSSYGDIPTYNGITSTQIPNQGSYSV